MVYYVRIVFQEETIPIFYCKQELISFRMRLIILLEGGISIKIGFIGAGKVGFSLGRYLRENQIQVTGFYSQNPDSAKEAALFTDTKQYHSLNEIVSDNDVLFLTVPDTKISTVWEEIKQLPIHGKCIIHCSGAISSAIFLEINQTGAFGYSIHPLFAINDKYTSFKELSNALFTIEGDETFLVDLTELFQSCGNTVQQIEEKNKVLYHAAAVMTSNLVVGLVETGVIMMKQCGFSEENAYDALQPLMMGNLKNVFSQGTLLALTGPIERNDVLTVKEHLEVMKTEQLTVYRVLSNVVLEIAEQKHPDRDYGAMKEILK